jgi:hypothetical protein
MFQRDLFNTVADTDATRRGRMDTGAHTVIDYFKIFVHTYQYVRVGTKDVSQEERFGQAVLALHIVSLGYF